MRGCGANALARSEATSSEGRVNDSYFASNTNPPLRFASIKRVAESVHTDLWVKGDVGSVENLCDCILELFRDEGERKDRQKARLISHKSKIFATTTTAEQQNPHYAY